MRRTKPDRRRPAIDLVTIGPVALSRDVVPLEQLRDEAEELARDGKARATQRAYGHDWRDYAKWCATHDLAPLPSAPAQVALYLTALVNGAWGARGGCSYSPATLARRLAAIAFFHRMSAGGEKYGVTEPLPTRHPRVRLILAGARRRLGAAPHGADALSVEQLREAVRALPATLEGLRDRAVLLVGFGGAFRRSELAGLLAEDLRWVPEGLVIRLRTSKTNQEGKLEEVALVHGQHAETCAIRALRAWLDVSEITRGPVFRSVARGRLQSRPFDAGGRAVDRVVRRALGRTSVDRRLRLSAHSLRSGFVTAAARAGEPNYAIRMITRHRTDRMLLRYVRTIHALREHPGRRIDL